MVQVVTLPEVVPPELVVPLAPVVLPADVPSPVVLPAEVPSPVVLPADVPSPVVASPVVPDEDAAAAVVPEDVVVAAVVVAFTQTEDEVQAGIQAFTLVSQV